VPVSSDVVSLAKTQEVLSHRTIEVERERSVDNGSRVLRVRRVSAHIVCTRCRNNLLHLASAACQVECGNPHCKVSGVYLVRTGKRHVVHHVLHHRNTVALCSVVDAQLDVSWRRRHQGRRRRMWRRRRKSRRVASHADLDMWHGLEHVVLEQTQCVRSARQ
jgi:hypothetical protein